MSTIVMAAWGVATIVYTGALVAALASSHRGNQNADADNDWFFDRWKR
jgi:hypothetical protein